MCQMAEVRREPRRVGPGPEPVLPPRLSLLLVKLIPDVAGPR